MSNQSKGLKKSQFSGLTTIPADAYFDFVSNGTNYRIAATDFFAALGVTGTLEQAGDALGVPVLSTAGTVNKIRNIEPGSGISSSVSAENGVAISHNFQNGSGGVDLLTNIAAVSPILRALSAGTGVSLAISGETIEISSVSSNARIQTKTAAYTALNTDRVILADATAGAFTVTLPTAASAYSATSETGQILVITKIDSGSSIVTIDGDGTETVAGSLTQALTLEQDSISIISDGSNWHLYG